MNWITPLQTGLEMGLVMFFAVLGLAIAFRLLNFPDLTIEGSFLLGAVGFAVMRRSGFDMWSAILTAQVLGAFAGVFTGSLHARFHINKFLAAVIVVSICYSVALRLMGTSNIGLLSSASVFDQLDSWSESFGLHFGKILFLLGIACAIGGGIVLALSSRTGLKLRVAGCNPTYARTLGIGVVASTMVGLAVTNALAALSGALLAVHQGFADVGLGQGVLIFALASMSLGDRLLSERRLSVPIFVVVSSMVGSVVYQYLIALSVSAGLNPVDLKLITAVLVLILVIVRTRRHDDPFVSV